MLPRALRPVRLLALLAAPALALALTPPATAATPSGPDLTLTISLRAADPAGLSRAASLAQSRTPAQRAAALAQVTPRAAARTRVVRALERRGFAVTGSDTWSVTVTAPADLAAATFGTRLVKDGRYVRPASAPAIPGDLAGAVIGVAGLDTRPIWRHHAFPDGHGYTSSDLRSAYAAVGKGGGTTVATVQYAGWDPADLGAYAKAAGLALPTGQYTGIGVGRSTAYDSSTDGGGDFEVALDQESLLAAAPEARQRAYIGVNQARTATDVWNRIADDVLGHGITAVSTSWGACELELQATQMAGMEQAMQAITAAGATIFAAAGDYSAYDCNGWNPATNSYYSPDYHDQLAVDYPASSQYVVSVGGTTLTKPSGSWQETTWGSTSVDMGATYTGSCTADSCGDGTGGGYSTLFSRPSWQSALSTTTFPGGQRLVPDISSVAALDPGIIIYSSGADPSRPWYNAGGTSAGPPVQAGMFVDALAQHGRTTGIGDIHDLLYTSAPAGSFRDVTTGANHAYAAGTGYDLTTGLGSPLWTTLLSNVPDVSSTYVPVTPVRVADTRTGQGVSAGQKQGIFSVTMPDQVPAAATAVVLNVSVTRPSDNGFVRVFPSGFPLPQNTSINFSKGLAQTNLAKTRLGDSRAVAIYVGGGPTDVVVDLTGYYLDAPSGARYVALADPGRIADTRTGQGVTAGSKTSEVVTLTLPADTLPAGATSAVINLSAVAPEGTGWIRVYAAGATEPSSTSVNFSPGHSQTNLVITQFDSSHRISVKVYGGPTDLVADLLGYFAPAAVPAGFFTPVSAARFVDTRLGVGAPKGAVGTAVSVAVPSSVPADAVAVVVNLSAVNPVHSGWIRVYPSDVAEPQNTSVNFLTGQSQTNLVITRMDATRHITINVHSGPAYLVADLVGYYRAATS